MKIKSHFEDVDQQNAKVKAVPVTIKNKTRQVKFSAAAAYPSQPVSTRWGSWLIMLPCITQIIRLK